MASATYGGTTVESNDSTSEELAADLQPVTIATDELAPEKSDGIDSTSDRGQAEPKPKPRSDPQARVQDATAKEATAKRERDEARAESAQLRARLDALEKPKPAAEKPVEKVADWKRFRALPDAPKLADFDGPEALEDHAAAMADFVATKRYEESRRKDSESEALAKREAAYSAHYSSFQKRMQDASGGTTKADFIEWVSQFDPRIVDAPRAGTLPPGQPVTVASLLAEEIYWSEAPVEKLLAHFSDEPEVQRLATLLRDRGLGAFTREFARIEARLTTAAAPLRSGTAPEVKESKAKPPIRPERGSSQVGNDEPPGDDASEATYEAYWQPRRAKLRHA